MGKKPKGRKLTDRQEAVIRETVRAVNEGEGFSLQDSIQKISKIKRTSAHATAHRYMKNDAFRETLMQALEDRKIIGADSKVERVLAEGLDATLGDNPDHKVRLDYAKEINKISGVYAPQKIESKNLSVNMDLSREEVNKRIKELQQELEGE